MKSRRNKVMFITILLIICLGIFFVLQEFNSLRHAGAFLESSNQVETYSVKEAIDAMSRYIVVQKLMEDPLLVSITSTDSPETENTIESGGDGKRPAWNGQFGDINGSKIIVCALTGSEIKIEFIDEAKNIPDNENGEKHLAVGKYRSSDIKLDSKDQVVLDKIKELNLMPGNPSIEQDWIKGYHYSIHEPATESKSLILAIYGISPESPNEKGESMMAICEFNAKNRSYIGALKKTGYDKDGRSIWEPL